MFNTVISIPANLLPASYVAWINKEYCDDAPYQGDDLVDDVPVEVEHNPGWYQPGCRSGHPDNWTPDEGEDPEILSVTLDDPDWTPQEGESLDIDFDAFPQRVFDALLQAAHADDEESARQAEEDRAERIYEARRDAGWYGYR